jgi:SagB-type dehydrogenase family enzyme
MRAHIHLPEGDAMLLFEDAFALSLLFHLNSEPWNNTKAYTALRANGQFKTVATSGPAVVLPEPPSSALADLIAARQSCRNFAPTTITLHQLAAVLHAGYGITGVRGEGGDLLVFRRAVPSAGGLYPLELYVVCNQVEGTKPGLHHFNARNRTLEHISGPWPITDLLPMLMEQTFIDHAAALIFITAVLQRTLNKYGPRGYRYVLMEAGHVAQNICLRATELDLATLCLGGFSDHQINSFLELDGREEVALYGIALGESAVDRS